MFHYFEKKHKLPANSLHSISLHETAKKHSRHNISVVWPWTVMNNKDGTSHHFKTQNEAIKYVRTEFRAGNNNLDVGCMQINLKYHPEAFSSLYQAFSPRRNVAYGAHFLNENVKKLGSIEKAIGRYHSATEHLAVKYRSHVSKINHAMGEYKNNLNKVSRKIAHVDNRYVRQVYDDSIYRSKINVGRTQNNDWVKPSTQHQ